ncbi:MAG: EAL domain-containing protein [Gammaproteobacteria bacterium]|nr:EAL domain-containing protein [Gammaproteobacteria bacterium]
MKLKQMQGAFLIPLIIASIGIIVASLYFSRVDSTLQERYSTVAKEMRQQIQTLIDEKKEAILLIAMSMSHDQNIREAIQYDQPSYLNLSQLSEKFKQQTSLNNLWFQVVKNNGTSFYRSWTKKRGDNVALIRLDIAAMLKEPKIISTISTGKFDLTFKAMVPIYANNEFIGIFEVIAKFNSIADKLEKEGINSVFLVDKSYKKQLTKPFTNMFVEDYYVTNLDVKEKYLDIVRLNRVEDYIKINDDFQLDETNNLLVVYFSLLDIKNNSMGHFILFRSLDEIDVDDIYNARYQFLLFVFLFIVLLFVVVRYLSDRHVTNKIKEINLHLEEKVTLKNKELIEQGIFLQSVMDGVSNSVTVIDKNFNVTMMNKLAQKNTGRRLQANEKLKCYKMSHNLDSPCNTDAHKCPHHEVFATGKMSRVVHEHISLDGKPQFIEITATPLLNEAGEVDAIIELGHDITDHIMIHEQLQQQTNRLSHQANHDALTGLPNRVLFVDRVAQTIKQSKREHLKIAILFIDLDRFKEINDTLGHSVGDEILIEIAQRLKNNIRSVDTVARLGGDEFTLILANVERASIVMEIAQKLVAALSKKILYEEHELYVTASIGISLYPDDGIETEVLLRNADSAMYQAKNQGRNNYQFYTQKMTEQAFERMLLEKNLRRAINEDEFIVYYQPQYNSRTNKIIGMEALLRWQHPEMGLVSPAKFIPIAEETGMIIPIGWIVIDKVIKQLVTWSNEGHCCGHLSINLSVKQIQESDFIQKILETLDNYDYDSSAIQFEVTESYIMTDPELAINTLKKLKSLNFEISIDDFGTGYSSLSYLKRLPVNELKIDQSFVRDVPGDEEDEAIVRSIISLAKSLNLHVIAEGVETKEQQKFLLDEQCENIQGYLIQRPVCAKDMTEILRMRNEDE